MTQGEIAEKQGISTSGLNYCLKALIDKGWVKVQNFNQSKNKFGFVWLHLRAHAAGYCRRGLAGRQIHEAKDDRSYARGCVKGLRRAKGHPLHAAACVSRGRISWPSSNPAFLRPKSNASTRPSTRLSCELLSPFE